MSVYRYTPLSPKPNVIRLLRLLPSADPQETLRCELFEYMIRLSDVSSHPYEALSYCWGGDDNPQSIVLDNERFNITQNLWMALLRLRDSAIPRIIWVDAVCINQKDHAEKATQIQFMAAIYAKARCVIVWLGEDYDNGDLTLESIRIAANKVEGRIRSKLVQDVKALLARSWFRRIWVMSPKITFESSG